MNVDFEAIKFDYKFFCPPVWESGLIVLWKTAKNYVFRIRPLLR